MRGGPGNDILVGGKGDNTLDGGPSIDILIDGGSVKVGKSLRTANKKSHGLIDWDASYGDSLTTGRRVGSASYLFSPSWVRQFVVGLGSGDRNRNTDIRVVIPDLQDLQFPGGKGG